MSSATSVFEAANDDGTDGLEHRRSKIYWDKSIANDPPMVDYEQVMNTEEGVWEWLKRIVSVHASAMLLIRRWRSDTPRTPLHRIFTASVSCRVSQARLKRPRP